jgi:hypothetical protein
VPPKRRVLQVPHAVTYQKTQFFTCIRVYNSRNKQRLFPKMPTAHRCFAVEVRSASCGTRPKVVHAIWKKFAIVPSLSYCPSKTNASALSVRSTPPPPPLRLTKCFSRRLYPFLFACSYYIRPYLSLGQHDSCFGEEM